VELSSVSRAKAEKGVLKFMKKVLSLGYGLVAYGIFLPTLVYAILFIGNMVVPKTIDSGGMQTSVLLAAAIDTALLGAFAAQHSIMARQGFKRLWTQVIPKHLERPTYVLASSLVLILLLWQWRAVPQVVWALHGPAATLLNGTFWLGWTLLFSSTFLINHFELFGVQQVWGYFRGKGYSGATFRTPVLYRIVRHPLYLGFVIAFWSAPRMSLGHLIFSIATTGYILLGIHLEERDLVAEHGESYRSYRERVPMLIPFPKSSKQDPASAVRGNARPARTE
jgi:protein-S-isoprenylcysteine O-methyltransferase Ste14